MTPERLLDLGRVWEATVPEMQRRLGIAALLFALAEIGGMREGGGRGALFEECRMIALDEIEDLGATVIGLDLDEPPPLPALPEFGVRQCRSCGWIDTVGCAEGCDWVDADLCSACLECGA
jgi:hypothetical protein